MDKQEKFDKLVERMELPENRVRRTSTILSKVDTTIAQNIADMREYLTKLNDTTRSDTYIIGLQFDDKYDKVVRILDEQGWA